jgi:hypothetical protein
VAKFVLAITAESYFAIISLTVSDTHVPVKDNVYQTLIDFIYFHSLLFSIFL